MPCPSARRRGTAALHKAAVHVDLRLWGLRHLTLCWEVRLIDLSEAQVCTIIEVAVGSFQDAMRATAQSADAEVPF
jgi:hypothetical protein